MSKIEESAVIRLQFGTDFVILFLDFDGVLHPDPCLEATRLFENAPRLAAVVNDFPRVALVLSTAWRQGGNFEHLLVLLPETLRSRVIGVTPNFSDFSSAAALVPYRRHAECLRWLQENRLQDEPWIALDDRASGFIPYCENLIECDPQSGFNAAAGERLRSTLERDRQGRLMEVDLVIG